MNRQVSNKPEFNCSGSWSECSPKTAETFSAVAYFFGKKLYEELNIPIGLIHSSWGGTPVESWISGNYLDSIDEYKPVIEKIRESGPAIQQLHNWIQNHKSIDLKRDFDVQWENINFNDEGVEEPSYNDSNWKTMELPALWESTEVGNFDGVVWFRKKIKIPDDWVNQNLVIELGPIDDIDVTFINGNKFVGMKNRASGRLDRIYNIPKDIITTSEITIAVKVVDNQAGGGIYGKKENMNIHIKNSDKKISLAGEWKEMPVAEFTGDIIYMFMERMVNFIHVPKDLFNYLLILQPCFLTE